jgi:hypothetical protein
VEVSLDQAIDIHARSLRFRCGIKGGQQAAAERAKRCAANGDSEGSEVWSRVALKIPTIARSEGVSLAARAWLTKPGRA